MNSWGGGIEELKENGNLAHDLWGRKHLKIHWNLNYKHDRFSSTNKTNIFCFLA
jgi:hypothetical protein